MSESEGDGKGETKERPKKGGPGTPDAIGDERDWVDGEGGDGRRDSADDWQPNFAAPPSPFDEDFAETEWPGPYSDECDTISISAPKVKVDSISLGRVDGLDNLYASVQEFGRLVGGALIAVVEVARLAANTGVFGLVFPSVDRHFEALKTRIEKDLGPIAFLPNFSDSTLGADIAGLADSVVVMLESLRDREFRAQSGRLRDGTPAQAGAELGDLLPRRPGDITIHFNAHSSLSEKLPPRSRALVRVFSRMESSESVREPRGTNYPGTRNGAHGASAAYASRLPWFAKFEIPPFVHTHSLRGGLRAVNQLGAGGRATMVHGGLLLRSGREALNIALPVQLNGNYGRARIFARWAGVSADTNCPYIFDDLIVEGPYEEDLREEERQRFVDVEAERARVVRLLGLISTLVGLVGTYALVFTVIGAAANANLKTALAHFDATVGDLAEAIDIANAEQRAINLAIAEIYPERQPVGEPEDDVTPASR
jgi:hypothetical protein